MTTKNVLGPWFRLRAIACCMAVFALALFSTESVAARSGNWPTMRPKVTGPLDFHKKQCLRFYSGGSGQRFCGFLFTWDGFGLEEINPLQDYGVVWLQNLVQPAPGFCVFDVRLWVNLSSEHGILEHAPDAPIATRKPRAMRTRLVTDADGWALEGSTLTSKQKWTLFPDGLNEPREESGPFGTRVFEWKWTGWVDREMHFAAGLTFNWGVATGLVNELLTGRPPAEQVGATSAAAFQDCRLDPPEVSPLDGFGRSMSMDGLQVSEVEIHFDDDYLPEAEAR